VFVTTALSRLEFVRERNVWDLRSSGILGNIVWRKSSASIGLPCVRFTVFARLKNSNSCSFRSQATPDDPIGFCEQEVRSCYPLVAFVLSFPIFHGLVDQVPPLRCFAWHLWCHVSSSSWFFVFRPSILPTVFLFFYCRLSILISNLFPVSLTCALCVRNISICPLQLRVLESAWA
jgi:hypothetical protein